MWRAIRRPEYLLRPEQVWRRIRRKSLCARNQVRLAWGLDVDVDVDSRVGSEIVNLGVFERIVPETILRLLDPGETGVDVGANIGQNTSVMALAAGRLGTVFAFEPAPESWRMLTNNLRRWAPFDLAPITAVKKGISARAGHGQLYRALDPGGFSLEENPAIPSRTAEPGDTIGVDLTTLDAFFSPKREIGVMKVDVEGHELAVFQGGSQLLDQRCVRDIIFEDYHPEQSGVCALLESLGYQLFWLTTTWRKPMLRTIAERIAQGPDCRLADFLATRDPQRAQARFESAGWHCLKVHARRKNE